MKFSEKEKQIGEIIFKKFAAEKKKNQRLPLILFNDLNKILNVQERELLNKILVANLKEYGKNYAEFYGIKSVPKSLVAIKNRKYFIGKNAKIVKTQFLPKPVFESFVRLNNLMKKEIGRAVNVASCYRSLAYQAIVLFNWLYQCKWNMKKALRRVTLPGCSEHGYPSRQAVGFNRLVKEIADIRNFYKTKEYKWVLKNACKFGFFLSYPVGNKFGVDFESWHWHYISRVGSTLCRSSLVVKHFLGKKKSTSPILVSGSGEL